MDLKKAMVCMVTAAVLTLGWGVCHGEPQDRMTTTPGDAPRKTPAENIFTLENSNEKFILLDHDEEGFYIISHSNIGRIQFDPDDVAKFDVEDENNIAYKLNHQYLTEGLNNKKLPQAVIDHLVLRDWPVEAGVAGSGFDEDYTVRCKVALMSMTEWKKYYRLFGAYDDESWWGWHLRTSWGAALQSKECDVLSVSGENAAGPIVITAPARAGCGIRPVFYLDKDFFTTVKCNVNTMGAKVRKRLQTVYSDKELLKLYSPEELRAIQRDIPPKAYDVWAVGYRNAGDTLTGYYKFYQEDGIPENGTTVRWVRSEELNGRYTVIPGTSGKFTYQLQDEDAGKYVSFEVVPAIATTVGEAYRSQGIAGSQVMAACKPEARSISIFGNPAVGEEIGVTYTYYDANRELEDGTRFQWQRKTKDGFADIPGATDQYYTIAPEDAGAELRVCIVPRNTGHYRLTGPCNDGRLAVGDPHYSSPVKAVALPQARNVKIGGPDMVFSTKVQDAKLSFALSQKGRGAGDLLRGVYEYEDLLGIPEENSAYAWEVSKEKEYGFLPVDGGDALEYTIREGDGGRYVRFAVTVRNKEGITGKKQCSEPVWIGPAEAEPSDPPEDSAEVTLDGQERVILSAKGLGNAYAVSFELEGDGVRIKNVEGIGYRAYHHGEKPVVCVLVKEGLAAVNQKDADLAVIQFENPSNGTVRVKNFKTAGITSAERTTEDGGLPAQLYFHGGGAEHGTD